MCVCVCVCVYVCVCVFVVDYYYRMLTKYPISDITLFMYKEMKIKSYKFISSDTN